MKRILLSLVTIMACVATWAAEGYAVFTANTGTLTFYYGTKPSGAFSIDNIETNGYPDWYKMGTYAAVTRVVFDASFAQARPKTTQFWFYKMEKLTTITGMQYFNTSESTNMMMMFDGCQKLTSIDLSHFNTAKVINMSQMFQSCDALTSLDLSSFNTSKVTSMSQMFFACSELASIKMNSFNTSNVSTMFSMFLGCSKLTSLDMSTFNTAKVTDMRFMFYSCEKLKTIIVDKNWSTAAVTASNGMFSLCSSIVGGAGTTYDSNHLDASYAHIDGGPSNPGYLTGKTGLRGDVNGDGKVNVSDVSTLINMILGITPVNKTRADVNGDGKVNVSDVTALINIILGIN